MVNFGKPCSGKFDRLEKGSLCPEETSRQTLQPFSLELTIILGVEQPTSILGVEQLTAIISAVEDPTAFL